MSAAAIACCKVRPFCTFKCSKSYSDIDFYVRWTGTACRIMTWHPCLSILRQPQPLRKLLPLLGMPCWACRTMCRCRWKPTSSRLVVIPNERRSSTSVHVCMHAVMQTMACADICHRHHRSAATPCRRQQWPLGSGQPLSLRQTSHRHGCLYTRLSSRWQSACLTICWHHATPHLLPCCRL